VVSLVSGHLAGKDHLELSRFCQVMLMKKNLEGHLLPKA
jgi:hypothetical protein